MLLTFRVTGEWHNGHLIMYSSTTNPCPPHGKIIRDVLKANILEAKYEAKLGFSGGMGWVQNKKPFLGGVWIFAGPAQSPGALSLVCTCIPGMVPPTTTAHTFCTS